MSPRAAGDKGHYTFSLRDENTGRHTSQVQIKLPSVTTVIGRVLAKPELVRWAYRETRDVLVSLAAMVEAGELDVSDFIDTMSDPDMAEEWLKANELRPEDSKSAASKRGHEKHAYFERLGQAA